ncbi:periodic tryptophan protein 2 homolog [Caerostris extrusa]|uniref:Periodic tryptophan protein 2 homolog n=1 Tax=Caerostris extrusa TaxID=172846 RepID=A0AAV4WKK6_CAEEX|nr:periodic tryptophan protein 2 homolog [Caerostris extrusa]
MKFTFRFSNLIGTVYNKGNLLFTDGDVLISPVGNRINLYDLRKNKSETLPIESRYNFTTLALSPNGMLLVAVNEPGQALLISIPHRTVIHRFHFKRPIADVKFSPDGKFLAVTKENNLFIYRAPSCNTKQYNSFALEKVFHYSYDRTLCIDWTSDSRVVAVGGADMATKIYAIVPFENFFAYTLGSHTDALVGVFFEENSLNMFTVSKNGQVSVWECNIGLDGLIPQKEKEKVDENSDEEDDILPEEKAVIEKKTENKLFYKRIGRHFLKDSLSKEGYVVLTSATFHRKSRILVTGFSNGTFLLHQMPNCDQIHSLTLSNQKIASVSFNKTGDWIALGSEGIGQLVVWEWQSESFVMKQQGHFNNMNCLAYSPDGLYIASGGEDGKVKIWDTFTGFCFVTFTEHASAIKDVQFCQNGKAVVSASTDGTVRAFDLIRYRNFKTYTTPEPTKFSCLAVDRSSDIICAGSEESFEIYVWYLKTAHLLTVLSGHEAPISQISFSPVDLCIASSSWDKTARLWNIGGSKSIRETISLPSDGLTITYRPDGAELAIASLNGEILFFHPSTLTQTGSIEGRNDLHVGRRETDLVTAKKMMKAQAFTTLCYSPDGECILAGGRSKYICIYSILAKVLVKKFEITCNLSFDAVNDFINRRRMTHFGNKALIEERMDEEALTIPVPGSKKIDKSSRTFRPEASVSCIRFSPTGRDWAATTTEGLMVHSLDNKLLFDPFDIDMSITSISVKETLRKGDFSKAILMAIRLNLPEITQEVVESIKIEHIETLAAYLPELYAEKLFSFIVDQLETTPHLEFYTTWIKCLLSSHTKVFKNHFRANMGSLLSMQKCLSQRLEEVGKMCENTKFMLQYVLSLKKLNKPKTDSTMDDTEMELMLNGFGQDVEMDSESEEELSEDMIDEDTS